MDVTWIFFQEGKSGEISFYPLETEKAFLPKIRLGSGNKSLSQISQPMGGQGPLSGAHG